ncbi:hypothetical protein TNIN_190751 [Trichonephila inaurata madagascariensis]|uniref:Uncharacterized protein n=1 Tax=Trichonephila inaurata madagascariensis TaxID=2747483 RepID=A0A8X6XM21_9ARAC|nr:hypothetical protein TNIN_190751 [Trichonephila inaurata madagascariensis]
MANVLHSEDLILDDVVVTRFCAQALHYRAISSTCSICPLLQNELAYPYPHSDVQDNEWVFMFLTKHLEQTLGRESFGCEDASSLEEFNSKKYFCPLGLRKPKKTCYYAFTKS